MTSLFTVSEANRVIPEVIKKFEYARSMRQEVSKYEQQIQMSIGTTNTIEEFINIKQKLNAAITKFYESIEILEKTGVVLKSLDDGLLDFPSNRFDEEVWLCWKYGETEVKFWHEKDSGFSGRKPLEVKDESLV